MSNQGNTFLGILAGTAIGTILGILYAPDKGVNTRRRIAEEASHAKDRFVENTYQFRDQVAENIAHRKESLDSQIEAVVSNASYKAEDIITTMEKKLAELKEKNKKLQKS
ncbi:YtxH domain-containing protein [Aquimarina brevivitae]|uniref:Gas vesicle protein n=1 Tax=Aquimarina brevivitae TaxID=323412 RepID=A0A4V2F7J6_9FLAO|nr:YtxH domain-containing protein [Aquimarina brevivitae]RZT00050.1 gas vesicle protein [Aquimarina brevivitae]